MPGKRRSEQHAVGPVRAGRHVAAHQPAPPLAMFGDVGPQQHVSPTPQCRSSPTAPQEQAAFSDAAAGAPGCGGGSVRDSLDDALH